MRGRGERSYYPAGRDVPCDFQTIIVMDCATLGAILSSASKCKLLSLSGLNEVPYQIFVGEMS